MRPTDGVLAAWVPTRIESGRRQHGGDLLHVVQVAPVDPHRLVDRGMIAIERAVDLRRRGASHQRQRVDRKERIALERHAVVPRPQRHIEAAPFGFLRQFGRRMIARRLEHAAQQHRLAHQRGARALRDRLDLRVGEVAVGAAVVEVEFQRAGHVFLLACGEPAPLLASRQECSREGRMGRVADKVVLVTGAGSGIGRASAKMLAAEGATVIVTDVNRAGGLETVQQIGGNARFEEQDTSKEADWKRIIDDIMAREGRLNGLVNNAGIAGPFPSTFEGESLEQWRRILSINVEGVFLGCKHGVPALRSSGGGSIVNLSSLAAFLGTPDLSAYGASKGAVRQFTKTVAMDCARKGYKVRCNSVHPGIIMTPMGESILPSEKARERTRQRVPIGHFGTPEDIAFGVLYLISDESRFMTGAELVIDGGMNAI